MTADVRPIRTAAETALVEAFDAARARLQPSEIARRDAAFATLRDAGLPHRRVEEWKYTDLRAAMREARPVAAANDAATVAAAGAALAGHEGLAPARIVLVNGQHVPGLSDVSALAGVEVVPLSRAIAENHPLVGRLGEGRAPSANAAVALASAFADDGVILHVPAGTEAGTLHIAVHQQGEGHAAFARVLVVVEEGASVTVVETHTGAGAHQTASLVEFLVGDGATASHVKLQDEDRRSLHLGTLAVTLGAGAKLVSGGLARGAQLSRQQAFVTFAGADAHATIAGVMLAGGRRHMDTTLVVDHLAPGGESRERFKLVLADDARGVFQGRINVAREAQKTDGQMKADALLLGEGAEADLKPELEIFADDVLCAHGATAGDLDEELLFYLLARGIPRKEAETLLVTAFAGEALEVIADEALRERFADWAAQWLADRV